MKYAKCLFRSGFFYLFLLLLLSPLLSYGIRKLTLGFTLYAIESRIPISKPLSYLDPSFDPKILDQHFFLFNTGAQAFAFISEDGEYILKFFKGHHYETQPWVHLAPDFIIPKRAKRADKRLIRDTISYAIACHELQNESGLIAMQLGSNDLINKTIKLVDNSGTSYSLDLKHNDFILQKKAKLLYPYLQELIEKKDDIQARQAIQSLLALMVQINNKGIYDEDSKIHRNAGFVNNRPIFIDVGRFAWLEKTKDPAFQYQNLLHETRTFKIWLKENYPHLVSVLDESLEAYKPCPS